MTAGIVSAVGRNINEGPYDDYIQIDAPINRGNSGGPTFNLGAEVIGVNTAIYSPSGGSVGIGFAVPSNIAKNVVQQLKESGHVTRGWLGVAIQGITPAIAKSLGLNPEQPSGALVASVTPNSPAAKAGVKQGDVITSAGGHPVKQVGDLPRIVAGTPPGQQLDLTILRGGKEMKLAATLGELSESPKQLSAVTQDEDRTGALGLQLSADDPGVAAPVSDTKGCRGRRHHRRRRSEPGRVGRNPAGRRPRVGRSDPGRNAAEGGRAAETGGGQGKRAAVGQPQGFQPVRRDLGESRLRNRQPGLNAPGASDIL